VIELLEEAARECDARGDLAQEPLDDRAIWYFDAAVVLTAADTLRLASPTRLPTPVVEQLAPFEAEPLQLVQRAWAQMELLEGDPFNVVLLIARLRLADALAAVRTHYE
jgi:hypothetical protein